MPIWHLKGNSASKASFVCAINCLGAANRRFSFVFLNNKMILLGYMKPNKKRRKKMKKIVAIILCSVMTSSTLLCGCSKSKEEKETSKTESVTETEERKDTDETEVQTEESESETQKISLELNDENIKKVSDYYSSIDTENDGEAVFFEGIRGSGHIHMDEDDFYIVYDSLDYDRIELRIDWKTGMSSLTFDLDFDDETSFYGRDDRELDGLEEAMDNLIRDLSPFELYNDSALSEHKEEIKKNLPIMYARLITLADNAFPELGLGLKDMVPGFCDKYRAIDPTQLTSEEVEVTNDHQFVNGVCSDCGMEWTEYFYDAVGQVKRIDEGQRSMTGQDSAAMVELGDYVQCTPVTGSDADIYYHHKEIDNDKHINNTEMFTVYISNYDSPAIEFGYSYEQGMYADVKFSYYINFSADPGECDKIFESKEAFTEYAEVFLIISEKGGDDILAWETMSEDEIQAMFESSGNTYYTKEAIIDRFWEYHENYLASMDNAMVWLDTTLEDAGVNWK